MTNNNKSDYCLYQTIDSRSLELDGPWRRQWPVLSACPLPLCCDAPPHILAPGWWLLAAPSPGLPGLPPCLHPCISSEDCSTEGDCPLIWVKKQGSGPSSGLGPRPGRRTSSPRLVAQAGSVASQRAQTGLLSLPRSFLPLGKGQHPRGPRQMDERSQASSLPPLKEKEETLG